MSHYPDSVTKVREDQERDARRRLTLNAGNGGYQKKEPSFGAQGLPKKPFIAKGHDAILNRLQNTPSANITVQLSSGGEVRGRVVARDKFTITVLDGRGTEVTIYKHAIESFTRRGA